MPAPDASTSSRSPATSGKVRGPWTGRGLHVWTTSCEASSPEVVELIALAAKLPRMIRSVGVACTAVSGAGALLTFEERPVGLGRREVATALRARGLATTLVVSNFGAQGFDGALALAVLTKKPRRVLLAEAIVLAAEREGFDSVELDLELMPTAAAAHYAELAREVRTRLPPHKELVVDVHPKTVDDPGWDGPGAHDYAALAASEAVLRLMTYDLSIGPVPAGPSTKATWIHEVVAYARGKGVPEGQLEIGLPAYGYDFPPSGKGAAAPIRWQDATQLRAKVGAPLLRDAADVPHYSYDGPLGRHEVWFDDERSLSRLLTDIGDLAGQVRGVAVWGIGRADPNLGKCLAELGFAVATAAPR